MTAQEIKDILINEELHSETVDRIIASYEELRLFYGMKKYEDVGNHVGNFCENAGNLILDILGADIKEDQSLGTILDEIEKYNNTTDIDKTIRLTIPRFLRAIYDLRSYRDTVHVNLKVPVNHADQNAAVNMCSWILAELVRAYGEKDMEETANLIETLASDTSPYIDEYKGRKLVLSGALETTEELLIHLYNAPGALSVDKLVEWIPGVNRKLVQTNLSNMEDRRTVFYDTDSAKITPLGAQKAEAIIDEKIEK